VVDITIVFYPELVYIIYVAVVPINCYKFNDTRTMD